MLTWGKILYQVLEEKVEIMLSWMKKTASTSVIEDLIE